MSLASWASPGVWPPRASRLVLCFDYVLKVVFGFFLKKINPSEHVILNIKVNISDGEMPEDYLIRAEGAAL